MPFLPAHDLIGQGDRLALVCHGILGSRRNWRTFARALAERLPGWQLATVDLRGHGDSHGAPPPHTLAACARDLANLAAHLGRAPEVVVGHSFGGKVALAYAEAHGAALEQAWVLDASPEAHPPEAAALSEVASVISALDRVSLPLAHRADVVALLTDQGFSLSLARWMTTNLRREGGGYVWRFDLPTVRELLADYLARDLWLAVDAPRSAPEVYVVRAARSDRWSDETLARLALPPPGAPTHLLTLAEAGHWVHVDAPEALLQMMVEHWVP